MCIYIYIYIYIHTHTLHRRVNYPVVYYMCTYKHEYIHYTQEDELPDWEGDVMWKRQGVSFAQHSKSKRLCIYITHTHQGSVFCTAQ